ncbi:MAG: DUF2628 domain-containing protein [Oscillospiraceae bacterium]|nr:DUF2628 domain-containing protein [Oscillospiraceae bacterium]
MDAERTVQICVNCGAVIDAYAKFCPECGYAFGTKGFEAQKEQSHEEGAGQKAKRSFENGINDLLHFLEQEDYIPYEDEENRLIGTKTDYYRGKFNEMRMLRQKVSLNWAALFFGVFWMLYRKMYGVAGIAIAMTILIGFFGHLGSIASLVLTVCYGMFGNYLYMMTIQKRVTDLQQYAEPARTHYLEKYSGVSGLAVVIGLIVVTIGTIPYWIMIGLSFLSFVAAFM